jgi:hypothetical protein
VQAARGLEDTGLLSEVNEVYLLHGTHPDTVLKIATAGFNERYSGSNAGTLFGEGNYYAEVVEKIDQYCTEDAGPSAASDGVRQLHRRLGYGSTVPHPGNVCYALVSRVCLGYAVHTQDAISGFYDDQGRTTSSLFYTGRRQSIPNIFPKTKRELASVPHTSNRAETEHFTSLIGEVGRRVLRHREFVVMHGDRAYPEYLVAYERRA